MPFPTVDECIGLSGAKRELLHEFDHLLRDALQAMRRKALHLSLECEEVGSACVTVMMTVAAGAAIEVCGSPSDVTDAHFSAVARDALAWVRQKAGDPDARAH
jgi:hypothetical protein